MLSKLIVCLFRSDLFVAYEAEDVAESRAESLWTRFSTDKDFDGTGGRGRVGGGPGHGGKLAAGIVLILVFVVG